MNKKIQGLIIFLVGIISLVIFMMLGGVMGEFLFVSALIMTIGIIKIFAGIKETCDNEGRAYPFPVSKAYHTYPEIKDFDETSSLLTGFRNSVADYLKNPGMTENSSLQNYASQLQWHALYLQKKRLIKKNIVVDTSSKRCAYSNEKDPLLVSAKQGLNKLGCLKVRAFQDGRYNVKEIYEEINARRTYEKEGLKLFSKNSQEVCHYSLLSAKQTGDGLIVCPNCGSAQSRESLIDGCDYCGTKFLIEDMQNKIGCFAYRKDIETEQSKKELAIETLGGRLSLRFMLFFFCLGVSYSLYQNIDKGIGMALIGGIGAGLVVSLLGLLCGYLLMNFCAPVILVSSVFKSVNSSFKSEKDRETETKIAKKIQDRDPQFSLQSFYGSLQNKLSSVVYAENEVEMAAFANRGVASLLNDFKNVVDMDVDAMTLTDYKIDGQWQVAVADVSLDLVEVSNSTAGSKNEKYKVTLIRNAEAKTEAVCGPLTFRCSKCGSSHSLLYGRVCAYCGNEVELEEKDWVIKSVKKC